jgi:hypothetical protein
VDEINRKLSGIDKIYKKINEMDDFSRRLSLVEHGLKAWGENYNDIKTHVVAWGSGNKELNSPNSHSHHPPYPPPRHSPNFGSLTGSHTNSKLIYQDLIRR